MPNRTNVTDMLDGEFLEMRARLLQLAAQLDWLDRAGGGVADDARMAGVRSALEMLLRPETGRAEKVQLIFSRPYDEQWKQKMEVGQR
jgi:hypothetical protein